MKVVTPVTTYKGLLALKTFASVTTVPERSTLLVLPTLTQFALHATLATLSSAIYGLDGPWFVMKTCVTVPTVGRLLTPPALPITPQVAPRATSDTIFPAMHASKTFARALQVPVQKAQTAR